MERVHRRHTDQPGGQPTIEAGALAMRVNQIGARVANDPLDGSQRQREHSKRVEADLVELDTERSKVRREPLIPRARDRDAELVRREMTNDVEHLARTATRRRGGHELEDANHAS
jgi:hypothetical protein